MELELIQNTRTFTHMQLYFDDFDEPETLGLELEDSEIVFMKDDPVLYITNNEEERDVFKDDLPEKLIENLRNFMFSSYIHPDVLGFETPKTFNVLSSFRSRSYEVYLSGMKVGNFKDKEHIKQVMGDYVVVEEKSPEDNVRIFVCEKA